MKGNVERKLMKENAENVESTLLFHEEHI